MLEQSELVLRPWAPAAVPTRRILDGRDAAVLGRAVRREAEGWRVWPWSRRERLEVYETEDESLLMTVSRGWANTWKIHDAEERLVGQLRGNYVFDAAAQCLAVCEAPGAKNGRLISGEETLAEWACEGGEMRLVFADRLEKEPFAKMVLLAAVLTQTP